jgi:hypothetical protein
VVCLFFLIWDEYINKLLIINNILNYLTI